MARQSSKRTNGGTNGKRPTSGRLTAVIDIGSNSVRMVVFQGLNRVPQVLFNERVLCGLGRDVNKRGRMDEGAVELALTTLSRYAELCRDMRVDHIETVATAAARDAENGEEFVARVEAECGFTVKVLSGVEEARLTALGVLAGTPDADGIAADLGGGSLELVHIVGGKPVDSVSLPIGPLRLQGKRRKIKDKDIARIEAALGEVSWLADGAGRGLYIIGGAWRAIAKLHIIHRNGPLPVLHGYRLSSPETHKFCRLIIAEGADHLKGARKVASSRLKTLPLAALILDHLVSLLKPKDVIVSAPGIREGLLFGKLNHAARKQDPLIFTCKEIADATGRFPEHADRLMKWIDPLFEGEPSERRRLRFAVCLLSDISWRAHPDFRAERAYYEALLGRFVGVSHRERALIALALFVCYGGPVSAPEVEPARRLLSPGDSRYATVVGLALRLGQRLTGGTSRPLGYSALRLEGGSLQLVLPEDYSELAGERVMKRLLALADALGLEAATVPE